MNRSTLGLQVISLLFSWVIFYFLYSISIEIAEIKEKPMNISTFETIITPSGSNNGIECSFNVWIIQGDNKQFLTEISLCEEFIKYQVDSSDLSLVFPIKRINQSPK